MQEEEEKVGVGIYTPTSVKAAVTGEGSASAVAGEESPAARDEKLASLVLGLSVSQQSLVEKGAETISSGTPPLGVETGIVTREGSAKPSGLADALLSDGSRGNTAGPSTEKVSTKPSGCVVELPVEDIQKRKKKRSGAEKRRRKRARLAGTVEGPSPESSGASLVPSNSASSCEPAQAEGRVSKDPYTLNPGKGTREEKLVLEDGAVREREEELPKAARSLSSEQAAKRARSEGDSPGTSTPSTKKGKFPVGELPKPVLCGEAGVPCTSGGLPQGKTGVQRSEGRVVSEPRGSKPSTSRGD